MSIEFSKSELELIRDLLVHQRDELVHELHHTDLRGAKKLIRDQEHVVEAMIAKLQEALR